LIKIFAITLSQSAPPNCVSQEVDNTSNNQSPDISITVQSVVPPQTSRTTIFSSFFSFSPYANEAAVGSFIILSTFNHAISHAAFVAFL
jgi:hypothetical protein